MADAHEIIEQMMINAGYSAGDAWIVYFSIAVVVVVYVGIFVLTGQAMRRRSPKLPQYHETDHQNSFLRAVLMASPGRSFAKLYRSVIKVAEESGELAEAYLVVTSDNPNAVKRKTHRDIREEAIDTAIIALDVALTPMPGEEHLTQHDIEMLVMELQDEKLSKWGRQRGDTVKS